MYTMADINSIVDVEVCTEKCFSNCISNNNFYRINVNDLRQCLSKGKRTYTVDETFDLLVLALEYKDIACGWVPEDYDKDPVFSKDDGNYIFLKVPNQEEGKRLEQLLEEWLTKTADVLDQFSE